MTRYAIIQEGRVLFDEQSGWFYLMAPRKTGGPASGTMRRINLLRVGDKGIGIRVRQLNRIVTIPKDTVLEHLLTE